MELYFPYKGKHIGFPASKQPQGTSPDLNNVRPYDTLDNRIRGGQRPGLSKKYIQQIGGFPNAVVELLSVTVVS